MDSVDADRIVTRALAPPRRFSAFGMGALVCLGLGLPFVFLLVLFGLPSVVPMRWVLVCGFGIGATLHVVAGGQRAAASWAWAPFEAKCRAEAREALAALAVHPLVYWDGGAGHVGAGSECWPTGVAWDGQFIYVLDRGTGACIPPSLVRRWRWSAERAGTTGWFAVGNAAQVMLAQNEALDVDARNRQAVNAGNGLFLSVRDVDMPTWQFQTSDVGTLQRWAEILDQVFEGQPSAAPSREADAGGSEARLQPVSREAPSAPAEVETVAEERAQNIKLGAGLAALLAAAALLLWGVWPVDPKAYLSGSLGSVAKHVKEEAWRGYDSGSAPDQNADRYEKDRRLGVEAKLNRSLLAYSLAMPAGDRKREFLLHFCGEVLSQELTDAFVASGHRGDLFRAIVSVSPEGRTFGNGKLLSPSVLEAVARERGRLPSLPNLRRCSQEIPLGIE